MSSVRLSSGVLVALSAIALSVFACACASNSATGGGAGDSGAQAPPPDAGLPVNGCDEAQFAANDHTADGDPRIIHAPPGAAPQQYAPNCMRIKAGQTVTVFGDDGDHPVDYAKVSGPDPYPIVTGSGGSVDAGMTFTLTISDPGVVKFNCDIHPTQMKGAIEVVP
jgi:plastocyanin